jgi:hypothetical protein
VHFSAPILWVVDADGELWFSIEEVVRIETGKFVMPLLKQTSVGEGLAKLSHPALLGGAEGRIGGEIIFDFRASVPCWYLTNDSGRYGRRPGRKEEHLNNVARLLKSFGMRLRTSFLEPEVRGFV